MNNLSLEVTIMFIFWKEPSGFWVERMIVVVEADVFIYELSQQFRGAIMTTCRSYWGLREKNIKTYFKKAFDFWFDV